MWEAAVEYSGVALGASFAGCMVVFVLLRKLGLARLLMPHQGIIGAGVGLAILTGFGSLLHAPLASLGPPAAEHAKYIFLPQQAIFALAVARRKEASTVSAMYYCATLAAAVLAGEVMQSPPPPGLVLSVLLALPGLLGLGVTVDTLRHPLNLLAFVWMIALSVSNRATENASGLRAVVFVAVSACSYLRAPQLMPVLAFH